MARERALLTRAAPRVPHARCASCHSTTGACTPRAWSCPVEHGGCGLSGPDCDGVALSACPKSHGPNGPHVAFAFSAPHPRRALYRFAARSSAGAALDVVFDGSRAFLLVGRKPGRDVTLELADGQGADLREQYEALARIDAVPWGGPTVEEIQDRADRRRRARRCA